MKNKIDTVNLYCAHFKSAALALAVTALTAQSASASTATWNAAGNTWNTGANWTGGSGGSGTVPTSADDVILDNSNVTLPGTISLQAAESANSLTFGSANGAALGTFTLQANTSTTAESLALTSGNITLASQAAGNVTLGNSTNGVLTLTTGASGFTVTNNNSSQTLSIGALLSGAGTGLTVTGGGTVALTNVSATDNTFTGGVTITGGSTLSAAIVANGGSSSSLGASSNAAANLVIDGGTLNYTAIGSTGTTNRLLTLGTGGATLTVSGSKSLQFNNTGALAYTGTGARTLTFGGAASAASANTGLFAPLIADGTGGATTVVKSSINGRWTLTNANTYSGGTFINGGVLAVTGTAQALGTGNVTVYGGGELQIAALSNLAAGKTIAFNGFSNNYATVGFGFDATTAQINGVIGSGSTNGTISLFSDSGMTTANALDMSAIGDGAFYLGSGGIAATNNAVTTVYGASSLGVGAGNVYRLGGGDSISGISTLQISHDVLVNGSGNTLQIGAPGSTNIVQFTTNNSGFTGATTVNNGSLSLFGANGGLSGSAITVNNGQTVIFDDTTSGVTGATRAAAVTLNGGSTLSVNATGNTSANVNDTITGALAVGSGSSGAETVTLTPGAGKNIELSAGSFSRTAGSTVLFQGTGLGTASISNNTSGAASNVTNISFGTTPTLVGGSTPGTSTYGVIVGAYGDTSASGTGLGLVTYDSTNGVRLLASNEYASSVTDGTSTQTNLLLAGTPGATVTQTYNSNTTINSLSLTSSGAATSGNAGVTINGTGTLKVTSGMIFDNQTMTGTAAQVNVAGNAQTISAGTLDFGTAEGIIIVGATNGITNSASNADLNISSVITGSGGLTKSGSGFLTFSGSSSNTYSGITTINGGNVDLDRSGAVSIPGDLVINAGTVQEQAINQIADASNVTINGGTLSLRFSNSGSSESDTFKSLTMNGGSYVSGATGHPGTTGLTGTMTLAGGTFAEQGDTKVNVGGLATFSGGIATINNANATNNTYDTIMTLSSGLTINNTAAAAGAYTPITIVGGTSATNNGGALLLDGDLTFNGTSTNVNTVTIAAPAGTGGGSQGVIALSGPINFKINDGAANVDLTVAAPLVDGTAPGLGGSAGSLNKTGAGTLALTGASTYSGGTTVTAGNLKVNNTSGSATGTGLVDVLNTATLSGGNTTGSTTNTGGATLGVYASGVKGIITGPVVIESGAHLAPGNSVGTLTVANLTLNLGSVVDYEFNGTANDFTAVASTLTLNGGGFNLYQEGTTNPFDTVGVYDLMGYSTLAGAGINSLSVLNEQVGFSYTFINDTTDGLVQLDIAAIPEPGTWAMMLGGFSVLVFWQRRKNGRSL